MLDLVKQAKAKALAESRALRVEAAAAQVLPDPEPGHDGWWVTATCPHCAGRLHQIADGRPTRSGTTAVTECTACGRHWVAVVRLVPGQVTAPSKLKKVPA